MMTLIFIIEDNESVSDSLVFFIKYLAHYDTLIANSAELAYDILMKGITPDLILLDIKLPGMDGIDFLSRIRRDTKLKDIKVIIYSGMSEDNVRKDLEDKNVFVQYIIQKPSSPKDLIAIITGELKEK
jgi:CheY-like chemotaxis protein